MKGHKTTNWFFSQYNIWVKAEIPHNLLLIPNERDAARKLNSDQNQIMNYQTQLSHLLLCVSDVVELVKFAKFLNDFITYVSVFSEYSLHAG